MPSVGDLWRCSVLRLRRAVVVWLKQRWVEVLKKNPSSVSVPCSKSRTRTQTPFLIFDAFWSRSVDVYMRAGGLQSSIKSQSYALLLLSVLSTHFAVLYNLSVGFTGGVEYTFTDRG